jgi:pyruvate,water dikinase
VVLEVSEFRDVRPGEILITNATDPGWTCLFSLAGGVVMEMGGMLSHGAILAREYGLPAVASVAGATKAIPTGSLVEIDGLKGQVRLLEPA